MFSKRYVCFAMNHLLSVMHPYFDLQMVDIVNMVSKTFSEMLTFMNVLAGTRTLGSALLILA